MAVSHNNPANPNESTTTTKQAYKEISRKQQSFPRCTQCNNFICSTDMYCTSCGYPVKA